MGEYTYTGTTWYQVWSSSTDTNTVWYCVMNDTIGGLTGANYSQKIESIEITFSNNYGGNWYLGIGYSDSDNWNWDYFTHMSPEGTGTSGQIGYTTYLLEQGSATTGALNTVSFTNIENYRTVIPSNSQVRFILYTYTQPTSSWGINSGFSATIYTAGGSSASLASASIPLIVEITSSSITFQADFENCLLNDSSYPLCYYYSTLSNNPGSTYNTTNTNSDIWHKLPDSNSNTLEYTINGLTPNTTYYIWVAGSAEFGYNEQYPISIEINGSEPYTRSSYYQVTTKKKLATAKINQITNTDATTCRLEYEFKNNQESYILYYFSSSNTYNSSANTNGYNEENKWCKLDRYENSPGIENITIQNEGTYYFWVATRPGLGFDAERLVTIGGYDYTISERVEFYKDTYSKCSEPTNVKAVLNNNKITLTWGAGADGRYNPLTGYSIGYSTSNSPDNLSTVGKNSRSIDFLIDDFKKNRPYYFFVASIGTQEGYDSSYVKSSGITILMSHPRIERYSIITKAQIDELKKYKSDNPTEVIQYNKITATTGNSYKTNSASIGTKITADWYNDA